MSVTGIRPEMMRLGEVSRLMTDSGLVLAADPTRGRIEIPDALPDWAVRTLSLHYDRLVYWWRHSPCVILVCDSCGQWKVSGKRTSDGSHCFMGGRYKVRKLPVAWGCQGTFRVVDLPWAEARPKRKRKKVAA
jgi:hypothetical protein